MIKRAFGADERPFALKVAQWRDLEKARDCGIQVIAQRLAPLVNFKASKVSASQIMSAIAGGHLGTAFLDDVREPLLQGLIGGGMTSTEAGILVRKVFDEGVNAGRGPVFEWCDLAFAIVTQALMGLSDEVDDEDLGEGTAVPETGNRSPTAKPDSQTSMAPSA